jgi:2,4-dienoyl-CoA reductase-like NADH-dependent reductase (Old Yellow Enzyme family)
VAGPGYQVGFASAVRRGAGVPVSAVGIITDAGQAERVLAEGDADAIMAGREWLRDPHFALRAAAELGQEIGYWPKQYLRARPA